MKLDTSTSRTAARCPAGTELIRTEDAAALLSNFLTALEDEPQPHSALMLYAKARAERQLKEWGIAR